MVGIGVRPAACGEIVMQRSGFSVIARYWCPVGGERDVAQKLVAAEDGPRYVRTFFESWFGENVGGLDLSEDTQRESFSKSLIEDCRRWLGLEAELVFPNTETGSSSGRETKESPPRAQEMPRSEQPPRQPTPPPPIPPPSQHSSGSPQAPGAKEAPKESWRAHQTARPAAPQTERAGANHISIESGPLEIRMNDSDLPRVVVATAEIECFPASFFSGNRASEASIRELLVREVRYFCSNQVGFHRLHFELRTAVRQELALHLGHELQRNGIGNLLTLSLSFGPEDQAPIDFNSFEHHELEVEFALPNERDTPILVRHRLELELVDLGRFTLSNISDLKDWLNQHLSAATRSVLFNMSYLEIVGEFLREDHRPLDNVRSRVAEKLEAAGFRIQHMVLIPDLPPLRWRAGVDLGAQRQEFQTQDRRVSFALELKASGVVPNPLDSRLRSFLEPSRAKELPKLVRSRLVERLQREFDEINPEDVYMRFDRAREKLTQLAVSFLQTEFGFEDINVSLLPLETELTRLVGALCQDPLEAEVEVPSLREGALSLAVKVRIVFEVQGVEEGGWSTFKIRNLANAEQAKIKIIEFFQNVIRSSLKAQAGHRVRYVDENSQNDLKVLISPALEQVGRFFGLGLVITYIDRESTSIGKNRLEAELVRLESERTLLIDQKEKLTKELPDPEDEEIRKFEKAIEELSTRINGLCSQIAESEGKRMAPMRRLQLLGWRPSKGLPLGLDASEEEKP